jgi:hypothetical protein
MFTGVIDSTELRSRGGSSSQAGCGSRSRSRRSVSSMEDAMREQQEKFREELRQQQMAFLKEQSEYMAAYNAQAQQAMNVSVGGLLRRRRSHKKKHLWKIDNRSKAEATVQRASERISRYTDLKMK